MRDVTDDIGSLTEQLSRMTHAAHGSYTWAAVRESAAVRGTRGESQQGTAAAVERLEDELCGPVTA